MCCASRVTIKYLYTEYSDSNATRNIDVLTPLFVYSFNFFSSMVYDIMKKNIIVFQQNPDERVQSASC